MKRFLSPNLSEKCVPAIKQTTRPRICAGVWFLSVVSPPRGKRAFEKAD